MRPGKTIKIIALVLLGTGLMYGQNNFPQKINSIKDLDQAAVIKFATISDMVAEFNDTEVKRALTWIKDFDFILGGGDEIKGKGHRNDFEKYFKSHPGFREKFYPNIGGGENRAFGGSDDKWGTGAEFFRSFPGFWERQGVEKATHEKKDKWGQTPSYYFAFKKAGITIHVLQIHSPDNIDPHISSLKFLDDKLVEIEKLKAKEPGKHIVYVHAHKGCFFFGVSITYKKLGQAQIDNPAQLRMVRVADIVTDADSHRASRWWTSWDSGFWRNTMKNAPAIAEGFKDPNAAVWYNTGQVSRDGYLEFHVLTNPTRVTVQYIRNQLPERALVNSKTWAHMKNMDRLPLFKTVDGPTTYINDWSAIKITKDEPVSLKNPGGGALLPDAPQGLPVDAREFNININTRYSSSMAELSFFLSQNTWVTFKLYHVKGHLIREIYNQMAQPGPRAVSFETKGLGPGIYYISGKMGKYHLGKRFTVLR